jgi:hypothetical protein
MTFIALVVAAFAVAGHANAQGRKAITPAPAPALAPQELTLSPEPAPQLEALAPAPGATLPPVPPMQAAPAEVQQQLETARNPVQVQRLEFPLVGEESAFKFKFAQDVRV